MNPVNGSIVNFDAEVFFGGINETGLDDITDYLVRKST
jgi:hypothetical protein